jgi:hypothetical protein
MVRDFIVIGPLLHSGQLLPGCLEDALQQLLTMFQPQRSRFQLGRGNGLAADAVCFRGGTIQDLGALGSRLLLGVLPYDLGFCPGICRDLFSLGTRFTQHGAGKRLYAFFY